MLLLEPDGTTIPWHGDGSPTDYYYSFSVYDQEGTYIVHFVSGEQTYDYPIRVLHYEEDIYRGVQFTVSGLNGEPNQGVFVPGETMQVNYTWPTDSSQANEELIEKELEVGLYYVADAPEYIEEQQVYAEEQQRLLASWTFPITDTGSFIQSITIPLDAVEGRYMMLASIFEDSQTHFNILREDFWPTGLPSEYYRQNFDIVALPEAEGTCTIEHTPSDPLETTRAYYEALNCAVLIGHFEPAHGMRSNRQRMQRPLNVFRSQYADTVGVRVEQLELLEERTNSARVSAVVSLELWANGGVTTVDYAVTYNLLKEDGMWRMDSYSSSPIGE